MTSDRISCEVSDIDQATLGPCMSENDFTVTTNSAITTNFAKDNLKVVTNPRHLSHTPVTSRSTPFKCPLQCSSTEYVPSGKFSLASFMSSLRCLLFLFVSAIHLMFVIFSAISDEKENTYLYFNVVW